MRSTSRIKKSYRKRKKLTIDEKIQIAHDIPNCKPNDIINHYQISESTFKKLKIKLKSKSSLLRKKRDNKESSLTDLDKKMILNLVENQLLVYLNSTKIKRALKLNCTPETISKFLKRSKYKLHLEKLHLEMKNEFCNLVKNLPAESWYPVIFTDEKILQSFNNARLNFFRKRGRGFDKRYIYRIEKQSRFKLNLHGFISYDGVGELFVFKNKAYSADYIHNLDRFILPAISEIREEFVYQRDTSNSVFNYMKSKGIKVLQKRVNNLIYHYGQPKSQYHLYKYAYTAWKSI